jgi:hypothetical protein
MSSWESWELPTICCGIYQHDWNRCTKVVSMLLVKHYIMKTYRGSGSMDQGLIHLGTSWRWVVSFTPLPLYPSPGKEPPGPLDRRLGGPQSQSGWAGEVKILYSTGTRTLMSLSSSP